MKSNAQLYSFSERDGCGRILTAAQDIAKGSVVIAEEPYAMTINKRHAEVSCSYCGHTCDSHGTVYQVSPDDPLRYCSEKCITVDYPIHQLEISALTALISFADIFGHEVFRMLIRVACMRKAEGATIAAEAAARPIHPLVGR